MSTGHKALRVAFGRFLAHFFKGMTEAQEGAGLRRDEGWWRRTWLWLRPLLLPALFVASLVQAIAWSATLPIDMPPSLHVSTFAANGEQGPASQTMQGQDDDFAILRIKPETLRGTSYHGTSPLDRCAFRQDVAGLLQALPGLKVIGIDLDLSPVPAPTQRECTEKILASLHAFIQERPGINKVVLIVPVDLLDREKQTEWLKAVRGRGLLLADSGVTMQFGMVYQHVDDERRCPGLGIAMSSSGALRDLIDRQRYCLDTAADEAPLEADPRNIDFPRLARLKHYYTPGESLTQQIERLRNQGITRIILGPDYDRSGEFTTPLQGLSGLDIHAAIALEPSLRDTPFVNFCIDIIAGIVFGWIFQTLWLRYFSQRFGWHEQVAKNDLAYLWLVLGGVLFAALLLLLRVTQSLAYSVQGRLISVVPMAIGMFLDAFVLGSVHAVAHHERPAIRGQRKIASGWQGLLSRIPLMIWCLLVLATLLRILFLELKG